MSLIKLLISYTIHEYMMLVAILLAISIRHVLVARPSRLFPEDCNSPSQLKPRYLLSLGQQCIIPLPKYFQSSSNGAEDKRIPKNVHDAGHSDACLLAKRRGPDQNSS